VDATPRRVGCKPEKLSEATFPANLNFKKFGTKWNVLGFSVQAGKEEKLADAIVRNDEVVGSIPTSSTISCQPLSRARDGVVHHF